MPHGSQGLRPVPPLVALVAVCLAAAGSVVAETGDDTSAPDPLAEMGWAVTSGAAPGYVDDAAWRYCTIQSRRESGRLPNPSFQDTMA